MIIDQHNFDIQVFHDAQLIRGAGKSKGIDRKRHLQQVLLLATHPGHVMEFGVFRGKTMAHIASHFAPKMVWGFDSFVGLPEPWYTRSGDDGPSHPAGRFDLAKESVQPVFADNVQLVKGWFQDTIPPWMESNPGCIGFLHIDCDLYSSTRTVLSLLNSRIVPGTVIVFDEMYPWSDPDVYDLWAEGEYRALKEWLVEHDRSFRTLLRSGHQQCSIQIVQ